MNQFIFDSRCQSTETDFQKYKREKEDLEAQVAEVFGLKLNNNATVVTKKIKIKLSDPVQIDKLIKELESGQIQYTSNGNEINIHQQVLLPKEKDSLISILNRYAL